jgi:phage shock protein PspC (stress-responsive transcriptional regulator)
MTSVPDTRRELRRPHAGRILAGVAKGVADYLGTSPALVRLAFAALALVGGAGIVLYLAAALVVPAEGADDSIAEGFVERHRDRPVLLAGAGVAATLVVVALVA